MEKETLIDIILNDLKEIHALVKTFKGKDDISTAFVNLTRTKIANINEELSLLEQLNEQKETTVSSELSLNSGITGISTIKDFEETVEPSNKPIEGEAKIKAEPAKPLLTDTEEEKTVEKPLQSTEKPLPPTESRSNVIEENKEKADQPQMQATVLGESIKQEATSVNEVIATSKDNKDNFKQIGKPVSDVRRAIGINDRFYFRRELFGNNANLFEQTLDEINRMDSFDSALLFLQSNFNWDADNAVSESFYKSVRRRFLQG